MDALVHKIRDDISRKCEDLWRQNGLNYRRNGPAIEAAKHLRSAIDRGEIKPIDGETRCYDCGGLAYCYDHRDYSRPLEVEPVCRGCNGSRGPALGSDAIARRDLLDKHGIKLPAVEARRRREDRHLSNIRSWIKAQVEPVASDQQ